MAISVETTPNPHYDAETVCHEIRLYYFRKQALARTNPAKNVGDALPNGGFPRIFGSINLGEEQPCDNKIRYRTESYSGTSDGQIMIEIFYIQFVSSVHLPTMACSYARRRYLAPLSTEYIEARDIRD